MRIIKSVVAALLVGGALHCYAQNATDMETGKSFYIQSAMNYGKNQGGYWDIPGHPKTITKGSNIQVWDLDNGHDRMFKLIKTSDKGYYEIQIGNTSNTRVDLQGGKTADGASIKTWDKNGKANQQFKFVHLGGGRFKILEKKSGKAIILSQAKNANGTNVCIWKNHNGEGVEWYLIDTKTKKPFIPNQGQSVTDIDGNTYKVVQFDNVLWMAEELKTTRYNDGTPILNLPDLEKWEDESAGAYAWYENDEENKKYGAIYNHYAVQTGKLCPTGWKVPSVDEVIPLWGFHIARGEKGKPAVAMKSETGWIKYIKNPRTGVEEPHEATNLFGFEAKPTPSISGDKFSLGDAQYWRTETDGRNAMYIWITTHPGIYQNSEQIQILIKGQGHTVRCVKTLEQ
jgi:uncharacterized protein (TIGR02145 family)